MCWRRKREIYTFPFCPIEAHYDKPILETTKHAIIHSIHKLLMLLLQFVSCISHNYHKRSRYAMFKSKNLTKKTCYHAILTLEQYYIGLAAYAHDSNYLLQ